MEEWPFAAVPPGSSFIFKSDPSVDPNGYILFTCKKTIFCGLVNGFRIHIELSVKMHLLMLWSSLGIRLQSHENPVFMWVQPCGLQLPGIIRTSAPLFLLN